jgi:hypothetical protein
MGSTLNIVRGRNFFSPTPTMQMNTYDLNKIFLMMQEINVSDFYAEYTESGGHFGLLIYFKGPKEA